jgi:hypothetical protein
VFPNFYLYFTIRVTGYKHRPTSGEAKRFACA